MKNVKGDLNSNGKNEIRLQGGAGHSEAPFFCCCFFCLFKGTA